MASRQALIDQLADIAGKDNVWTNKDDMAPFLVDTRKHYYGSACCLVRPASTNEAAAIVKACFEARVIMVPQGGNTGHCGASIPNPQDNAVLINLSRMNRIRAIDPENNTITIDAGCVLQTIQEAAAGADRLFPLSLPSEETCQIGGNLSTNAGGVRVLRYGNVRDLTLGLEVVLPDGEIFSGLRELRKDNTGYDLKQLFIGAEGTLGIITGAVMKLFPLPKTTATAWLSIASPKVAVTLFHQLQERFDSMLTACELLSHPALNLVLKHISGTRAPLDKSPWYLLIELSGEEDENALQSKVKGFLKESLLNGAISDAVLAQNNEEARQLWKLRGRISDAQKAEGLGIKHDISVPISRLAEFIERCDKMLENAFPDLSIITFGHVGDGNLHYNQSMATLKEPDVFIKQQREVNRLVYDLVHSLGGSIGAEHGIGQLKRDELTRYKSPVEINMMRALKQALDPFWLMNPGKLISQKG